MDMPADRRIEDLNVRFPGAIDRPLASRLLPVAAIAGVLAYLVLCFFAFDVPGVLAKARGDMVKLFTLDAYAHKIHVVKRFGADDDPVVSLEGSRYAIFKERPGWIAVQEGAGIVDLGADGEVRISEDAVEYRSAGDGMVYRVRTGAGAPALEGTQAPEWMRVSETQVDMRPSLYSRIWITRSKLEIHRYFIGWENFWFDFSSPLNGLSTGEIADLAISGDRVDPAQPNWRYILDQFWSNGEWQHGEVFEALLLTVLMAVVGTLLAGTIALPMAFLAARNVNPSLALRFGLRRFFDFLRGIDTLIWSLIFIRAFGLGPLSGIFAIVFTDTGTFGKLFSEAIENADPKQAEGVEATGARTVQKYRFGVLPQILPLFVSQLLYYLESNTRSATVIGALGAGGIGLKLLETIKTRQDWENTLYIILLVVGVVILMDNVSAWLRRKLIQG